MYNAIPCRLIADIDSHKVCSMSTEFKLLIQILESSLKQCIVSTKILSRTAALRRKNRASISDFGPNFIAKFLE